MTYEEAEALIREHMDYGGNVKVAALAKALSTSTLTFHEAAVAALEAATKSLNAAGASEGQAKPVAWLIDWPDEPDLGHYFAEAPVDPMYGRSIPLYAHRWTGDAEPVVLWRAIAEEAECVVERGVKKLVLTEEMCVRLGTAVENVSAEIAALRERIAGMEKDAVEPVAWADKNDIDRLRNGTLTIAGAGAKQSPDNVPLYTAPRPATHSEVLTGIRRYLRGELARAESELNVDAISAIRRSLFELEDAIAKQDKEQK